MLILNAGDKGWVTSASSMEVQMSDPSIRLLIFSGIAAPNIEVDDDDDILRQDVIIRLGRSASVIHSAVCQVGLASIRNDESAFVFATEASGLEIDPASNELQLRVQTAVMGEESALHRFSYQVVAHVTRIASEISGTIRVPKMLLNLSNNTRAEVLTYFRVTANRVEKLTDGSFTVEKFIPVATATLGNITGPADYTFIDYSIEGCPFNTPLRVRCEVSANFDGLSAPQVAGPRPDVNLTSLVPSVPGVDFEVVRSFVP